MTTTNELAINSGAAAITTDVDRLLDDMATAGQTLGWCAALFRTISEQTQDPHIRALADAGRYLGEAFGNDLDVSREVATGERPDAGALVELMG